MKNDTAEFNELMELHTQIKSFKLLKSAKVLCNFQNRKMNKFNKLIFESSDDDKEELCKKLNLSVTAICAYTLTEYYKLWKETKYPIKDYGFKEIHEYWKHIVKGLTKSRVNELEVLDEFSLLNILSLLKKLRRSIPAEEPNTKEDLKKDDLRILHIILALCNRFIENQFASVEEGVHPVIFYRFLIALEDWKENFDTTLEVKETKRSVKEHLTKALEHKYVFTKLRAKYALSDGYFHWFLDELYNRGKDEMYRQIALYDSNDKTLFDVKRLVYSILIVRHNHRYPNNLIVQNALKIIFKEQFITGLLPIGHVVNNDFVKKNSKNKEEVEFVNRPGSANPILTSFECFNDMLSEDGLRDSLKKNHEQFKLAYNWVEKRLRVDSTDKNKFLGWYPEYERTHAPESWGSAYILLFLRKYCELVSELMSDNAHKRLGAINIEDKGSSVYDTYGINEQIDIMVRDSKCCSALVFGPPGTGKSTIAKSLVQKLNAKIKVENNKKEKLWSYIELTPGLFLSEGPENIISKANEIFDRLSRVRKVVVFFDEVDQLVKKRMEGDQNWIVPALLPKFSELREQKELKFILATNTKTKSEKDSLTSVLLDVDPAILRFGRIDLVLPMGAICWVDRVKILKYKMCELEKNKYDIKAFQKSLVEVLTIEDLEEIRNNDEYEQLRNFLDNTNNMPYLQIKQEIDAAFSNYDNAENIFNALFGKNESSSEFKNIDFEEFHKALKNREFLSVIRFHRTTGRPNDQIIKDTCF